MCKKCLSCREFINIDANKCKHCGSLQLKSAWVQPIFWVVAFIATVTPLIILAWNSFDSTSPNDVNIEFLSVNKVNREINFVVKNTSKIDSVVFDAFYQIKKTYSPVELKPTVIKGLNQEIITVILKDSVEFPDVISSIKAVVKHTSNEEDKSSSIEKLIKSWSSDDSSEWWSDNNNCTAHFLVESSEKYVKTVNFKCIN